MQTKTPLWQKISLIAFGLFLTVILLEAGLRLGGFVVTSLQEYRNLQSIRHKGSYRIMCVGESTTAAQYPPYLEGILNQRNIGVTFSVIDKGEGGTTTESILGKLEFNLAKYSPDMVITMMGINDYRAHIPYEAASTSKIVIFLKSFRTYKLARLLWLHILTKAREAKQRPGNIQSHEDAFKQAIALNPQNDRAYVGLGQLYQAQGKRSQAEELLNQALTLNPKNDRAYATLGWLYQTQGKLAQAEDFIKKAIALNPRNDRAYAEIGWFYLARGKLSQAEDAFKQAIELDPRNTGASIGLGQLYRAQGKLSQAEELLKQAIALNPQNDRAYGTLSASYEEMGKPELAEAYAQQADELRSRYYSSVTGDNHRKLKAILDARGIRLVCVQYPMRSLGSLKEIFEDDEEGITFVDNEKVFRNAVREDGYRTYFVDMFGGDFGHCTAKGNRLLAENIANTILKEAFHK